MRRVLLAIVVAGALLALVPVGALATGGTPSDSHGTWGWKVGVTTPGAMAEAPDGSTIFMSGSGTFTVGPGSMATGGGTFSESNGSSGTWTATGLDSFVSYGPAVAGFPIPGATGGEAKLQVSLSNGQTGTLTIFCVVPGSMPPPSRMEGIEVILGDGGSNEYTMEDGGNTVFLAT